MEELENKEAATAILPNPTTPLTPTEIDKDRYRKFFHDYPVYPSEGVISGATPSVIGEQFIHFRQKDIQEDVDWATAEYRNSPSDTVKILTELEKHIAERYLGNPLKWEIEFCRKGIDVKTTLDTVRNEACANCFHRNLVYAYVLQQLGFEAKVNQGEWVETTRNQVLGHYDQKYDDLFVNRPNVTGVKFMKGEKGEFHAFTFVKRGDKFYFADASLWVKDQFGKPIYPVIKEVSEDELIGRDIRVTLPNGHFRHYVYKKNELEVLSRAEAEKYVTFSS